MPLSTLYAVPLLVQMVAGNPATSAAVLLCLTTHDATILRRVHPVLADTVAGVPWCDTASPIHDVCRWRDVFPAAVGAKVIPCLRSLDDPALLAGLTSLDASNCDAITNVVIQRLPPTLRHLVVQVCRNLTPAASFMHLTALTSLNCSGTNAFYDGMGCLPPSLQVLRMDHNLVHNTLLQSAASFRHLPALRVLSWTWGAISDAVAATLPPTLEELDVTYGRTAVDTLLLTHLLRLRVFRASVTKITDATVAALPPSLDELEVWGCDALTPAVTFTHLTAMRTLIAHRTSIGVAAVASLPPSIVSLDVSHCKELSSAATLPGLPALQVLYASDTNIGNAFVASVPSGLTHLRIANCANITPAADVRHLTALRELQCSGTELPLRAAAALRANGCFAPAECVLRPAPTINVQSLAVLADGRLAVGDNNGTGNGVVLLLDMARDETVTMSQERRGTPLDLAVLSDGHRLAVVMRSTTNAGSKEGIEVWDTQTTPPIWCKTIACSDSSVRVLAVMRDGRLAAGCDDGSVRRVDVDAGTIGGKPSLCHGGGVTSLAVLREGALASGSYDTTVRVWAEDSHESCLAVLAGHKCSVRSLAALANGHLASASDDATVRLWDVATWSCYAVLTAMTQRRQMALMITLLALPDGRLASASQDGVIRLWDTHTCTPSLDGDEAIRRRDTANCGIGKVELVGHLHGIMALALLADGRLASGDGNYIRVWRLPPLS